jgi:hypothetical protein
VVEQEAADRVHDSQLFWTGQREDELGTIHGITDRCCV